MLSAGRHGSSKGRKHTDAARDALEVHKTACTTAAVAVAWYTDSVITCPSYMSVDVLRSCIIRGLVAGKTTDRWVAADPAGRPGCTSHIAATPTCTSYSNNLLNLPSCAHSHWSIWHMQVKDQEWTEGNQALRQAHQHNSVIRVSRCVGRDADGDICYVYSGLYKVVQVR